MLSKWTVFTNSHESACELFIALSHESAAETYRSRKDASSRASILVGVAGHLLDRRLTLHPMMLSRMLNNGTTETETISSAEGLP